MNPRVIKFRVWNYNFKEMLDWEAIYDCGWDFHAYTDGEIIDVSPPMQFTGMKDITNKDIYEGDIVETMYRGMGVKIGEVYFQPTRLGWAVKHGNYTNQDMFVYGRPDCAIKVIGNIYQTPELRPCRG